MTNKTKGILCAVFACATWSTVWIISKILIDDYSFDPVYLAFLRFIIGGLFLLLLVVIKKDFSIIATLKKDYKVTIAMALTGIFGMGSVVFMSLKHTTATNSAILMNSNAIYIFLLSIFIGEKLTKNKIIGVVIGVIGCYFIINKGLAFNLFNDGVKGDLLAVLSAVLWAIYTVIGKVYVKGSNSLHLTIINFLIGSVMILGVVFAFNLWQGEFNLLTVSLLVFMGIIPTGLGFYAWYVALEYLEAGVTGVFQFIVTILTAIMAFFILDEKITIFFLIGMILIFYGIYVVSKTENKLKKVNPVSRDDEK